MDLSRSRFSEWLAQPSLDADLTEELLAMAEDPDAIEDAFGCELQFGTGGLRGIPGAELCRADAFLRRWHLHHRQPQSRAVQRLQGLRPGRLPADARPSCADREKPAVTLVL